jgi:hypothetical protein
MRVALNGVCGSAWPGTLGNPAGSDIDACNTYLKQKYGWNNTIPVTWYMPPAQEAPQFMQQTNVKLSIAGGNRLQRLDGGDVAGVYGKTAGIWKIGAVVTRVGSSLFTRTAPEDIDGTVIHESEHVKQFDQSKVSGNGLFGTYTAKDIHPSESVCEEPGYATGILQTTVCWKLIAEDLHLHSGYYGNCLTEVGSGTLPADLRDLYIQQLKSDYNRLTKSFPEMKNSQYAGYLKEPQ